ncbi:type II/IV secretion system protein [Candidatus Babeliales bacterium]|nr:type II/IV secretion system protein [Candidatus Babeliales bacterium]
MGAQGFKKDFIYDLLSKEEKIKRGITDDTIVSLVDAILYSAINIGASDIHLEQNNNKMRVRYRVDGMLYDQNSIDFDNRLAVLSRLKILSSLDISEKRIPQDGKLRVKVSGSEPVDLRFSTFPSIYGEKMVIRILDREKNCLELESLGFNPKVLDEINGIIRRPHGFFLVTGPTGSGKTTTLYAILSKLNEASRNIVTMEDPVEYDLSGITQSQINPKAGFTFQKGLRSILRQDPDIVMVGEIRDRQTAQIAIEAALTGHLVLSTLHTNDSASAITRLIDMGVEPFLINASVCAILAQRLVRKLCKHCKEEVEFGQAEQLKLKEKTFPIKKVFKPNGCDNCFNLGHKGRTGVFELLTINDGIRDLISKKASTSQICNHAIKDGMIVLLKDAIDKVKNGIVSIEEVLRIICD